MKKPKNQLYITRYTLLEGLLLKKIETAVLSLHHCVPAAQELP